MRIHLIGLLACAGSCLASAVFASNPTFLARRDYALLDESGIAVADTNGDGILDVIGLSTGEATVLFGTGKGTFRQGPTSQLGIYASIIPPTAADLNGDGKIDIIVAGGANGSGGIGVLFGNGDGTFQPAVYYPVGTDIYPGNPVLGDFNGDGIPDIAVAASSGLWLFTGKGGGAFNPGVLTPLTGTYGAISAADFNGDGKLDVAVTTVTGFVVLFGNGDGTFQPPQPYLSPYGPSGSEGLHMLAAPLSRGHRPDIVMAYQTGLGGGAAPTLAVYRNNGTGSFSAPSLAQLPTAGSFAIGDANGDGIPDLVSGAGYIAIGNGNGTFQPPNYYPLPTGITVSSVVLADLRHNGRNDLVFQDGEDVLSVLLNFGKGRLEDGEWIPVTGGAGCGAAADYNGDGKPDLAINRSTGISILLGTGKSFPAFTPGATMPLSGAGCLVTGDLNNDGIPDLLVPANGTVVAYLGNGDGTFTQTSVTSTPTGGYLALGDFNHDGKLDFATSGNLLAYGNGDGTFQQPVPIVPGLSSFNIQIAAADLNNDGWTDILLDQEDIQTSYLYVLLNDQHGAFTENKIHIVDNTGGNIDCGKMVLVDLNGDGNLDLVFGAFLGDGGYVYLGDGKGGFTFKDILSAPILTFGGGSAVAVSDLNGDGIPDIVLTAGATLYVYLGDGSATLRYPSLYIGAGLAPGDLLLENLHGQATGLPDIVAPDVTGGVMVLINATR